MGESPEDLLFLADIHCRLSRFPSAIAFLTKLIALQPALTSEQRPIFSSIFKSAVDVRRKNLRALITSEAESPKPEVRDALSTYRAQELASLESLCNDLFSLIDTSLLPSAVDRESAVFFNKIRADFSRYLCEFVACEQREEAKVDAERAYKAAISIARESLVPASPIRLATILNYSVFKYEHCEECAEAARLLNEGIADVEEGTIDLSEGSTEEAHGILHVMLTNLKNWGCLKGDGGEEEEEEEEEEEGDLKEASK